MEYSYIMRKLIILVGLLFSTAVYGQAACSDAVKTHEEIAKKYGEKPFFDMHEQQTRQLILYMNPQTGTWTVFAYKPELNQLCAVTAGDGFKPAVARFDPSL
jgi:hypothetical protein